MSDTKPWPYHIDNKVRAIHFALDPECPYMADYNCPDYRRITQILDELAKWESYRNE